MKIVLVGTGKVGGKLLESLASENHDIYIVDTDPKTVDSLVNKFDVFGVVGSGSERDILLEAGVDKADLFIACTSRDEFNMVCCVLAKGLGVKYAIARVRDPEYIKETATLNSYLGIDMVFNPEYRTAMEIAQILKFPSALKIESFASGKAMLIKFHIANGNHIIGKTVMDLAKEVDSNVIFATAIRDEEVFIPRGDFVIEENDDLYVIGKESDIVSFSKKINLFKPSAKSVFIIGGGKVGYYLTKKLIESGVSVKIIENNEKRCVELSDELPKASIIYGDGSEQELLEEENISEFDACVTLTGMDELNVMLSLFAKEEGVDKVITKVDRPSIIEMVSTLGIDTCLSPRTVIADHVLRFARSRQSNEKSVRSLYKIHEKVEAIEFIINEESEITSTPLKDLKVKGTAIIAGIIRGNDFIKPGGETNFLVGDKVLVVTTAQGVTELEQIIG
ncbi:MAG: Trk system potassium transporter TrkA [Clostridia bacterium]|nr:Trk system potassium transporter TrkA [Clostridia bacterium]